jgi:iron complex outermembrane receptor protein
MSPIWWHRTTPASALPTPTSCAAWARPRPSPPSIRPVGTYVDDIYLSRQNANNLALFDVARVEVLRGPQGTLFGRNTTGGAINVIMAEPGDTIGGYAEVGYGRYDRKLVRGSIDLPLADSFAIKVSGYWQMMMVM